MNFKYCIVPLIYSLTLVGCVPTNNNSEHSISFKETEITLEEETSYDLKENLELVGISEYLIWSTSNDFIATIDQNGLVTGVCEGSATISVHSSLDRKIEATCNISVIQKREKSDSEINFTSYQMKTYHYTSGPLTYTEVYYRDDQLVKTPYISLKNYYNLLTNHEMTITKTGEGTYILVANGEEATVNTTTDVLTCADYQMFISSTIYRQENVPNVYYDGAPFLRIRDVTSEEEPEPITINFAKYNINLFGRDDDIYLPVATASNMFMGPTMLTCFTTADALWFIDPNDPHWETGQLLQAAKYQQEVGKSFTGSSKRRTKAEARFAYGELCFLIDTYYGLPGREYLHNELAETRDLDKVLLEKNDVTRQAREFLLSQDVVEYLAGLRMLAAFVDDAGHSVADYGARYYFYYNRDLGYEVDQKLASIGFNAYIYEAESNTDYNYRNALSNAHYRAPVQTNNSYVVNGDTLYFRMDQFDFNIYDWNKFYKNHTTMPYDAVGNFKRALDAYKDSTVVKNVVVDITENPGGYADIVAAYMGLMNCNTYQHSYDTIGRREITINYDFDKNFDGVFDEQDKNIYYNYNFAILCSGYSFSCGNLLPMQAKENGIVILGDKSGGGSCAVIDASSSEGLYVRLSCPDHLRGLDGTDYEFGVPADYTLYTKTGDEYDFSNFYKISVLSEKMNEFYSELHL